MASRARQVQPVDRDLLVVETLRARPVRSHQLRVQKSVTKIAARSPEGKHAASAFAYAFPVEAVRDHHGRLKTEMARRVVDKISRYAPNFKDIVLRQISFAPYHMQTMFGAARPWSMHDGICMPSDGLSGINPCVHISH